MLSSHGTAASAPPLRSEKEKGVLVWLWLRAYAEVLLAVGDHGESRLKVITMSLHNLLCGARHISLLLCCGENFFERLEDDKTSEFLKGEAEKSFV